MSGSDSPEIIVRPSTRHDADQLAAFIEPFVQMKKLLPRTFDELQDLLDDGFVAEFEGQIIGFAALEIYSSKLAEVRSLAVAAEHQGHGVGKRLVLSCIERAREKHILEVMAITSAEPFFRACGFDFTLPGEKKALFLQTRDE